MTSSSGGRLTNLDALASVGADVSADASELYRRMVFNALVSNVDDHLRNHGFLWSGKTGWRLSPVYDVNPTPADIKPRLLSTAIMPDAFDCDVTLLLEAADYFNIDKAEARAVVRGVAEVTATWKDAAARRGAKAAEIKRMTSAFEHEDLAKALAL